MYTKEGGSKIHSHMPITTRIQSSQLKELVPSHLTKIPFDHVILEDKQSFAASLMWAARTQKQTRKFYLS